MTLKLRPELELELAREAAQRGRTPEEFAVDLLEQAMPDRRTARNAAAIALLRSWSEEGDEEDQRETFEALRSRPGSNG